MYRAALTSILVLAASLILLWSAPASHVRADDREPTYGPAEGTATAGELAAAMDIATALIVSSSLGASDAVGTHVFGSPLGQFTAHGGTFAAISSGNARNASLPNAQGNLSTELGGLNNSQGNDLVQLTLTLKVPAGSTAWAVDWKFLSEEYPEWVGTAYNDTVLIETPVSNFAIVGNIVLAPNNVAFDSNHKLITINTTGALGMSFEGALGTTYDGATTTLTTTVPIASAASELTVVFSVMDLGDSVYDSTVFLDNFRFIKTSSVEPITAFGTCGPPGHKTPTWGKFGPKSVLEFDSGEKLEVECGMISSNLAAFLLWYTSPGGTRYRVGMCPFEAGCNSAQFVYTGDGNHNDKPDDLIRTRWISRDYGKNDVPNHWTGAEQENPEVLDWAESVFDAPSKNLTKSDYKWAYKVPPPLYDSCKTGAHPEGNLLETVTVDPPVGPDTEAFFDSVSEGLASSSEPIGPMEELTIELCDLNADGACDAADLALLQEVLGRTRGEEGYNPLADVDADGVVTAADEQILFPVTEPSNEPPALIVPTAQTIQYSDWLEFSVSATDPNDPPDSLSFSAAGLCDGLTLTDNLNGTASIEGAVQSPTGICNAEITVADPDGLTDTRIVPIAVDKEDAVLTYSGDALVRKGSPLTLIAAVSEPPDGSSGDITNAAVYFDVAAAIGGASVSYGPVSVSSSGDAVFVLPAGLAANVYTVDVRMDPANLYYRADPAQTAALVVYDPSAGFTTGGGWIVDNLHRGNFGFNVKYLRKGGNIQGQALYIYGTDAGVVRVKSNSMQWLVVNGNTAIFRGKATVNGVGNHTFEVTIVDYGEPGASDTFAIKIWRPNGTLLHAAPSATLSGGNIVVPH